MCEYALRHEGTSRPSNKFTVSQVIALKIPRPKLARPYPFPQLFVGLSYVCAALIALELRRVRRKSFKRHR
jgi:hypothetical protein